MFSGLQTWWAKRNVPQKTLLLLVAIFVFVVGMYFAGYLAGKLIGPKLN
ncbi:hypothetical protein [Shewanella waksmanii]|nr:hypothetical protein [Shewanella waksmanii]